MFRIPMLLLMSAAWSLSFWGVPKRALAQIPLTQAQVEAIRNRVELVPQGRSARPARVTDILGVGDALRTAIAARAELRFNDGSLARIGERATFRFVPNTRNFRLSNGTVLLLIPPGRGRTNIQTPNAVTGIQGSALFVRYDPETDTTIIGALTQNPLGPMVASNRDASEFVPLNAGQMAVIQGNQPIRRYQFDLDTFYQTSSLIAGLNLTQTPTGAEESPLAAVQSETAEALAEQNFSEDVSVVENPDFIDLSIAESAETSANLTASAASASFNRIDAIGEFATIPTDPFSAYGGGATAQLGVMAIASEGLATDQTAQPEVRVDVPSGLIGRKQPRREGNIVSSPSSPTTPISPNAPTNPVNPNVPANPVVVSPRPDSNPSTPVQPPTSVPTPTPTPSPSTPVASPMPSPSTPVSPTPTPPPSTPVASPTPPPSTPVISPTPSPSPPIASPSPSPSTPVGTPTPVTPTPIPTPNPVQPPTSVPVPPVSVPAQPPVTTPVPAPTPVVTPAPEPVIVAPPPTSTPVPPTPLSPNPAVQQPTVMP